MNLEIASRDVLARAAETGTVTTVRHALRRYDPFMRGAIRRRVNASIEAAKAHSPDADDDTLALLAFLHALGKPWPASNYREDLHTTLDSLIEGHAKRRPMVWSYTLGLLGAIACSIAVLVVLALRPTPEASFRASPLGKAMGEPLTEYVIAVGKGDRAHAGAEKDTLLGDDVAKQIGAENRGKLEAALEAARALHLAESADFGAAESKLQNALKALDEGLANSKIPAYFDAYSEQNEIHAPVWVTGYFVQERATGTLAELHVPVVVGTRLDMLNLVSPFAVRRAPDREAIVSLDRAEELLLTLYLDAFADAPVVANAPHAETELRSDLTAALGERIASELVAEAKVEKRAMAELREAVFAREFEVREGTGGRYTSKKSLTLSPIMLRDAKKQADNNVRAAGILRHDARVQTHLVEGRRAAMVIAHQHEEHFVRMLAIDAKPIDALAAAPELFRQRRAARADVAIELAMLATSTCCTALQLDRIAREALVSDHAVEWRLLYELDVAMGGAPTNESESYAERTDRVTRIVKHTPAEIRAAAAKLHQAWFSVAPIAYTRALIK